MPALAHRDALQQETRGAIRGRREHEPRRQLFGALEVLLEAVCEPRRHQRHDALVAFPAFRLLDRHRELAVAEEPVRRSRRRRQLVVARDAADGVAVRALREDEPHRPRPLELQGQPALELERARHQRRGRHRLAERGGDGLGIRLMLDRRAPARVEPHQVAADRETLEQEAVQQVARRRHEPESIFFSNSFSWAGFALPAVAFITWPTKKPNSLSLPAR